MSVLHSFGEWELMGQLGVGGFGDVALWKHRSTNRKIATKRLKDNKNFREDEVSKLKQRWQQEYKWMLSTNTPFIVRGISLNDAVFMAYLNDNHAWWPLPVLVMEYCNGGDLRAQLQKIENLNGLHEYEVREVLFSLCRAIDHLHNKVGIEHRDLKPDNIVIHREGKQRFYKLTDFGFARTITHDTVLKSVVGTRNYFAPEVVDTAKYKNTVDYWSIGIIAFELMCGILPFIPHQDLFQIISNIRSKPFECIAITESPHSRSPHNPQQKKFIQHRHIFPQNRMTSVFANKIVTWLRSALDVNYKTRGTSVIEAAVVTDELQRASTQKINRVLTFYSEMDAILRSKILTIFSLNTYQFFSCEVTTELTILDWLNDVAKLVGIAPKQLYVILPAGHPHGRISASTKPIDFFVEEWQDTSNVKNPLAMLYITGVPCDYCALPPYISDLVKHCLSRQEIEEGNGTAEATDWMLREFELHTHYLLSNEERLMKTYLEGMKQYSLNVEHELFEFDRGAKNLQKFLKEICYLRGISDTFCLQVRQLQQINGSRLSSDFFTKWHGIAGKFLSTLQKIDVEVGQRTEKRYNSALRRAEEAARSTTYDDELKKRYLLLGQFQSGLDLRISDKKTRLEFSQKAIYDYLQARKDFFMNQCQPRKNITQVHDEYQLICVIVANGYKELQHIRANLEAGSLELLKEYTSLMNISDQMSNLSLDSSPNDVVLLNEDFLDDGNLLLVDAQKTINKVMGMQIDDANTANTVQIPTTTMEFDDVNTKT